MCNIRTAGKVTTALLVAIAVSAFAETSVGQTNAIDPAARQEIDHVISSYVDALNNWNSQTAASLILPQGLVVEPAGVWRNDGKQIKESIDILQKLGVKFTTNSALTKSVLLDSLSGEKEG
jgi:hypothetical protein